MIVYSYLAYTNVCKITTWLEPKTINFKSHSFLLKNLTRMVGPSKKYNHVLQKYVPLTHRASYHDGASTLAHLRTIG